MPGPAEPQFLLTGQALHQPHNNSLVSHEELDFVLKVQEDLTNLDNFVHLQNDVFSQNDNLSVFNNSYVKDNHLEPKLPPVKGRLAKSIKFWEGINASPWVLRIIKEGYALPFINEPEPAEFKNNASARKHSDFVTSEVKELLTSGRIREVSGEWRGGSHDKSSYCG